MYEISHQLHFAEHRLQEAALLFMACVYTIRLIWLTRYKAGKDRQAPTGMGNTNPRKGWIYSMANIALPWEMESTRKKPFIYIQFVFFHLGVVAAITLSLVIPYGPGLMEIPIMVTVFQFFIGAAFIVGVIRIIRRVSGKVLRAISTPDDYFSLILLTVWFAFAFMAVPNQPQAGETYLLTYFWLTAFFLVYVPFSKISHYLYYPFTRYYFGRSMGHRGVYPIFRKRA
jgi:nitrate reductase gamma subunit